MKHSWIVGNSISQLASTLSINIVKLKKKCGISSRLRRLKINENQMQRMTFNSILGWGKMDKGYFGDNWEILENELFS